MPRNFALSVAATAVAAALVSGPAAAITVSSPTFYQMDFYGNLAAQVVDTDWGDLEVTVSPDADPADYVLNLVVRADSVSPSHWVIRNWMIPASGDIGGSMDLRRFFDLGLIGLTSGTPITSLEYLVTVDGTPLTSAPSGTFTGASVLSDTFDAQGIEEGGGDPPTDPGTPPAPDAAPSGNASDRRKVHRDDVPHIEEGVNDCNPVSVTRSLRWLDDKNEIDLGAKTNAQLITDLKNASNWNATKGVPTYKDMLNAKLAVTKDLKMVNKFMVRRPSSVPNGNYTTANGTALNRGNHPTFDFICDELEDMEDVEILVGWMDGATRKNGHALTVIGCEEDKANNKKEITVQDDVQGSANATARKRTTRYTDGSPPMLNDLPSNRVEMVVSESPVKSGPALPLWAVPVLFLLFVAAGGAALRRSADWRA